MADEVSAAAAVPPNAQVKEEDVAEVVGEGDAPPSINDDADDTSLPPPLPPPRISADMDDDPPQEDEEKQEQQQRQPLSSDPAQFAKRMKSLKRAVLASASKVRDNTNRDISLIAILRDCREELEVAEVANAKASERLSAAKEVYTFCAQLLAGYSPLEARLSEKKRLLMESNIATAKRHKRGSHDDGDNNAGYETSDTNNNNSNENKNNNDNEEVLLPENPIHMPPIHTSGGGMSAEVVSSHRDNFYKALIGIPYSQVEDFEPPSNNANLKSKTQLVEWIYIARHWNTGADGLDAGAFRARHKTWYSRMKPVTENLGRRTGIHLRTMEGDEEGETVTVLCRYSKDGMKSVVYLDVGRIYDAIFEIHSVELGHRGRDVVKNRADERYANIPDGQVRAFIDTCPICVAKRAPGVRNMYA